MEVKDVILDVNNELVFESGDFKVDYSDSVHIQNLIDSFPGYWKQYPNCGVGVQNYLCSAGSQQALKNEIAKQLQLDGYTIDLLKITDDYQITLDAIRNGN
jgi:hypothetical protein